jgi:hypothetical protein
MGFFWFLTMLCAMAAALGLAYAFAAASAVAAVVAIGIAVIPYIFTRSIQEIDRGNWTKHLLKALDRLAPPKG